MSDPAEAADRLSEPFSVELLHNANVPHPDGSDMNDRLNAHVGEDDETIDGDAYCSETTEHDGVLASGIRRAGQGAENR